MTTEEKVFINECHCLTPWGNETKAWESMRGGKKSLQLREIFDYSEEKLPLSLFLDYDLQAYPARWEKIISSIKETLPARPWGSKEYPVFISSSNFGIDQLYAYRRTGEARFLSYSQPHTSVARVCELLGWGENVTIISHACVSAQLAIKQASGALQFPRVKECLVFSFDFLSPFVVGGFNALKILNKEFPCPYENREVGAIGLGEGIGWVVLTKQETPYEIVGQCTFNECYHMTANEPAGSGFFAIAKKIKAHLGEESLWIKGHGTGTLEAGRLEAESLQAVFPDAPLLSWKGAIGHTLGSCALIELAIALKGIEEGMVPGTIGTSGNAFSSKVQTENLVTTKFTAVALLSNAFGGAHASMVVCYA